MGGQSIEDQGFKLRQVCFQFPILGCVFLNKGLNSGGWILLV